MQHDASVLTCRLNLLIDGILASSSSASCVPSRFQTPSQSLVLKEGQPSLPDNAQVDTTHLTARDTPPTAIDNGDHIRLDSAQVLLILVFLFFFLVIQLHVFIHIVLFSGTFIGVRHYDGSGTVQYLLVWSSFFSQNAVVFSSQMHALGRYVFLIHYHQPMHPTFTVQIYVNGGRIWQGEVLSAMLCPISYVFRLQINEVQSHLVLLL